MEQVTVWMRAEGQGRDVELSEFGFGAILPQVSHFLTNLLTPSVFSGNRLIIP